MVTSLLVKAYEYYQEKLPGCDFGKDLEWYAMNGALYVGPDVVGMACVLNDGWFIRFAYGDLTRFVGLLPYELPKIGWAREGEGHSDIVWHPTKTVLRAVALAIKLHEKYDRNYTSKRFASLPTQQN